MHIVRTKCLEAPIITSGCCWGNSTYKGRCFEQPHRAGLSPTTKMLVPLFALLASSFLAVESSTFQRICARNELGTETTEEKWECTNGESSCTSVINSCSNDGDFFGSSLTNNYDANGNEIPSPVTGGGWDCRQICFSSD